MKSECNTIAKKLSEYIDCSLSDEESRAVAAHIRNCAHCAKQHSQLQTLIEELGSLPAEPMPDDFLATLKGRLPSKEQSFFNIQRIKGLSAVAAGLLILLLVKSGYNYKINKVETAYVNDAPLVLEQQSTAASGGGTGKNQTQAQGDSADTANAPSAEKGTQQAMGGGLNQNYKNDAEDQSNRQKTSEHKGNAEQTSRQEDFNEKTAADKAEDTKDQAAAAPTAPPAEVSAEQETAFAKALFKESAAPAKGGSDPDGQSDGNKNEPAANAPQAFYSAAHDLQGDIFVSVNIYVKDFDNAVIALKEKYDIKAADKKVVLQLGNKDFEEVMNLMLSFGATVVQHETDVPPEINICIIMPEKKADTNESPH